MSETGDPSRLSKTLSNESVGSLPSPPNPSADEGVIPKIAALDLGAPSPPLEDTLDVMGMKPETAMKLIARAVQGLANATGNVPSTPPMPHRPDTPTKENTPYVKERIMSQHRRTSSRPVTPVPKDDIVSPSFKQVDIERPEMGQEEASCVGMSAQDYTLQRLHMGRKFFSKATPNVSLEMYCARIQRYCPLSVAVWLAAGTYILKMGVIDKTVPISPRTVHRVVLSALYTAMKALEDLRYDDERFAGVTGVDKKQLHRVESAVCFLMDWTLQVTVESLTIGTVQLQRAAVDAAISKQIPSSNFELFLPRQRNPIGAA